MAYSPEFYRLIVSIYVLYLSLARSLFTGHRDCFPGWGLKKRYLIFKVQRNKKRPVPNSLHSIPMNRIRNWSYKLTIYLNFSVLYHEILKKARRIYFYNSGFTIQVTIQGYNLLFSVLLSVLFSYLNCIALHNLI